MSLSQKSEIVDPLISDDDPFSSISELMSGQVSVKPRSYGLVRLERAPNPVEFIESPEFLAGPSLYYPQFEVVRDFFELLCPQCNNIQRIRSHNDIPREEQILFRFDVCPKCGMNKYSMIDELYFYNEMVGVVGMRGGKSVLVACMAASMLHELLCIDNLQEKLGLVRNQEIDGAFVAVSGEQTSETIYGHFMGFYLDSPWFQNYKKALINLERLDPNLRRGDLYWETDKFLWFREKNIRIKTLSSNSGSIAGKTRFFAVIDELSRMDQGGSKRSAKEIYRVLKRSLTTIKAKVGRLRERGVYDIPDARMFSISSPLHQGDEAMNLLKTSEKNLKMFAFHRSTWEFNPDISKEDLADEYAADPVGAERDYGANPPGAESPFLRNPVVVEVCIDDNRSNGIVAKESYFEETIRGIRFAYIKMEFKSVIRTNLNEYVIHCDPGRVGDSFAFAMGHMENGLSIIDGAVEARPIPRMNKMGLEPREVYFPSMVDLIIKIGTMVALRFVSYDRWNSTDQIQRLRAEGIMSYNADINREDHIRFLQAMNEKTIRFPKREDEYQDPTIARNMPCSKALFELKRLEDTGTKIDHPKMGTNDVIQCYIGVHKLLTHPEDVIEHYSNKRSGRHMNLSNRNLGRVIHLAPKGIPRR